MNRFDYLPLNTIYAKKNISAKKRKTSENSRILVSHGNC